MRKVKVAFGISFYSIHCFRNVRASEKLQIQIQNDKFYAQVIQRTDITILHTSNLLLLVQYYFLAQSDIMFMDL